jgi:HEXXH motif-containing protein
VTFDMHQLAAGQFDELAAGAGELAGELTAGQVSRRVLEILVMLRETASADPVAGGHFAASYQAVAAVGQRCRAAVDAVLAYPQVGAWSAYTLRRLLAGGVHRDLLDDDLGHLGGIAAAVALQAGEGFDLVLRARADGTVMIPMFGLARLGVPPAWHRAWAEPGAAAFTIELGGAAVEVPVRRPTGSSRWWPVRRLASEAAGCRIEVRLDDVDPYRDCHRLGAAGRLPDREVAHWQAALDQAWVMLAQRHRRRALALSAGVTALVPLDPAGGLEERSGSSSDASGSVALTRPVDGRQLAAALVHEFQHSKLSAVQDLVPLCERGDGDIERGGDLRYAPWRSDPRPAGGLLQGAYAYLGLVDYWQVERLADPGAEGAVAQFEFARWRGAVREALRTLGSSGRLTRAGERFLGGMRRRLAELRALAVPAEPEHLAAEVLLDHWFRWRLHNLQPDPEHLAEYAAAWLAGAPRPPARSRPATVHSGAAWSGSNARLELTYRRLREPHRFPALCADPARLAVEVPGATPADAALVQGRYPAASRLYRDTVADSPGQADAWAGLVLAHRHLPVRARRALLTRPELVRALHDRVGALTGTPPDPAALASWLSGYRPPARP